VNVDEDVVNNITQLNILVLEKEQLNRRVLLEGEDDNLTRALETNRVNMQLINNRLQTIGTMMGRDFKCDFRILYEGIIMGVKNTLLGVQKRRSKDEKLVREKLVLREEYAKRVFGEQS
jgi:hypothetical protein